MASLNADTSHINAPASCSHAAYNTPQTRFSTHAPAQPHIAQHTAPNTYVYRPSSFAAETARALQAEATAVPFGSYSVPLTPYTVIEPDTLLSYRLASISGMPCYQHKSQEELRWEDYAPATERVKAFVSLINPFKAPNGTSFKVPFQSKQIHETVQPSGSTTSSPNPNPNTSADARTVIVASMMSVSAMDEYKNASFEELQWMDRSAVQLYMGNLMPPMQLFQMIRAHLPSEQCSSPPGYQNPFSRLPAILPSPSTHFNGTTARRGQQPDASTNNCVVCLDAQSDMVFTGCGHLCCCTRCSGSLSSCPICRQRSRPIKVYRS